MIIPDGAECKMGDNMLQPPFPVEVAVGVERYVADRARDVKKSAEVVKRGVLPSVLVLVSLKTLPRLFAPPQYVVP